MTSLTVTIIRTGGIAGLRQRWSVVVDPEAPPWDDLLERLPWDEVEGAANGVDRFTYVVTCERRTARIPEQGFTGAWRDLFDVVRTERDAERPGRPGSEGRRRGDT